MNNKLALESLCMDLKRVAIGYHRGSSKMAERFLEEAIKRKNEIDLATIADYIRTLLGKINDMANIKDKQKVAEDALMISTLLKNYTQTI